MEATNENQNQALWDSLQDDLENRWADQRDALRESRNELRELREEGELDWETWRALNDQLQEQEARALDLNWEERANLRQLEREDRNRQRENQNNQ